MPRTLTFAVSPDKHSHRAYGELKIDSKGQKVFVLGGNSGSEYYGDILKYEEDTQMYKPIPNGSIGKRAKFGCVSRGDEPYSYIFGGQDGPQSVSQSMDMFTFNSDTETVTKLNSNFFGPLCNFSSAYDSKKDGIWVFGGSPDTKAVTNDLHFFDCNSLKWTKVDAKNSPSKRQGPSMVYFEGTLVVYGGTDENGTILEDAYRYDVATSTWKEIFTDGSALPGPRSGAKAIRHYHSIYFFGGAHTEEVRESYMFVLNVCTLCWNVIKVTGGLSYTRRGAAFALDSSNAEDPRLYFYGGFQPNRPVDQSKVLDEDHYSAELFSLTGIPTYPLLRKSRADAPVEEPPKKRARNQLRKRKLVAAKVDDSIIFARIIKSLSEDRYEVEDADDYIEEDAPEDEENKLPEKYTVTEKDILRLPGNLDQHKPYAIGDRVISLYPDTSTFYPATVKGIGNESYYLLFDGEEAEGKSEESLLMEVLFKMVTRDPDLK